MKLKMETTSEQFEGEHRNREIANVLRRIADQIERGSTEGRIMDRQGETIGKYHA